MRAGWPLCCPCSKQLFNAAAWKGLKNSAFKGSLQPWVASKMVVERVEKVLLPQFQGLELHPDLLSQEGTAP